MEAIEQMRECAQHYNDGLITSKEFLMKMATHLAAVFDETDGYENENENQVKLSQWMATQLDHHISEGEAAP